MKLGDPCFGQLNEIITISHADCFLGIVSCMSGFVQRGETCLDAGGGGYLDKCGSTFDCAGDMKCLNGFCDCAGGGSYIYDETKNQCRLKQLGDGCLHDDDCPSKPSLPLGFTSEIAQCLQGKCSCSFGNIEKPISFIDFGTMVTKSICVKTDSFNISTEIAQQCDLDPILMGSHSNNLEICAEDFICQQCPEDQVAEEKGKCRQLKYPNFVKDEQCFDIILQRNASDHNSLTPTMVSNDDPLAGQIVSGGGVSLNSSHDVGRRMCFNQWQCSDNEQCLIPDFCHVGLCTCLPPLERNPKGNCIESNENYQYHGTAGQNQGDKKSLTIVEHDEEGGGVFPISDPSSFYFGMKCNSDMDCERVGVYCHYRATGRISSNGLRCVTQSLANIGDTFCLCPTPKLKWNANLMKCVASKF